MKNRNFWIFFLTAAVLLAAGSVLTTATAAEIIDQGTCGENLTWTFDDAGTLTISGTGEMTDWGYTGTTPWKSYHTEIKEVIIADGVTSVGSDAFFRCSSLTSINIPDSVKSIGNSAFSGCKSLTGIAFPDSVQSIGGSAFHLCESLESIRISESVESIGTIAFSYCDGLKEIIVSPGNAYYTSEDGVLFNKEKTKLIQYPIGHERESYTIADSVETLADQAFNGCVNLKSVTLGTGVRGLVPDVFSGCSALTNVNLGEYITEIGDYAFSGCDSLTSITIPGSVSNLGRYIFWRCNNLKEIYYDGTEEEWMNIYNASEHYSISHIPIYFLATDTVITAFATDEQGVLNLSAVNVPEDAAVLLALYDGEGRFVTIDSLVLNPDGTARAILYLEGRDHDASGSGKGM